MHLMRAVLLLLFFLSVGKYANKHAYMKDKSFACIVCRVHNQARLIFDDTAGLYTGCMPGAFCMLDKKNDALDSMVK